MQAIPVQLVHMLYTKISNHLQTANNARVETTAQALLKLQSQESVKLVIIAR